MRTEICSHGTLLGVLSAEPGVLDLLLVTNPGTDPPADVLSLARRVLLLQFDDFTEARPGVVLPSTEDVQKALDWSAGGGDLVVCCHAGVSRSAALAYIIRCRDWSPEKALDILTPGWHRPNALIVRLGAALLGQPGVLDAWATWTGAGRPGRRRRKAEDAS